MRRVVAIAVIAGFCFAVLLLYNDIKDFIWTHPWWHSFLVAIPAIAAPILAYLELGHSREASELRTEANNLRIRANALRELQAKSAIQIAELQRDNADLTRELDTERNKHLQQTATNTKRLPLTEPETNAMILRKYLGQRALVTEGGRSWGAMGAIIAEINENNIVTLFCPAGYYTSNAYGQPVQCDKLHIVEVPMGGCAVQLHIIERYGTYTNYGEARSWEERNTQPTHAGMPRGQNVFNAQYRKDGSPSLRQIYVFASTDASSNYTMVIMEDQQETNSWYSSKLDIEKKFAVTQVEWANQGFRYDGGGGSGSLNLFTRK